MKIITNTNKMTVTWRVKKHKQKFYVIDFIVADISLIKTKRSEFSSMLKKVNNNLAKLNEILKSQNESSYLKIID